jgi:uncharacterized membrane protein
MPISYHRLAGSSLGRLAALSDGVFAVAMTLLVLDLKVQAAAKHAQHPIWAGGSEHALAHGLLHHVAPHLLPYAMSFLTLGIFWVGQQTQLESFTGSTRALTWIHLAFLLAVTLMPFSTALLARDTSYRLSMGVYWLNLFALGAMLFVSLRYAERAELTGDETTAGIGKPTLWRVITRSSGAHRCYDRRGAVMGCCPASSANSAQLARRESGRIRCCRIGRARSARVRAHRA